MHVSQLMELIGLNSSRGILWLPKSVPQGSDSSLAPSAFLCIRRFGPTDLDGRAIRLDS